MPDSIPGIPPKADRRPPGVVSTALLTLAILLAVFPDVVFLGASMRPSDVGDSFRVIEESASSLFPESDTRTWEGHVDIGAAFWQMEAAQHFMAHCIRHRESPYWNPWVAAGSLGPETLVDVKFSVITVLTALFGSTPLAFHGVLLLSFFAAVFFVIRIVTDALGLSVLAGVAAGVFFILNGFQQSYQASQVVQPFLLAPMLLYGLLKLSLRPSLGWFAFCAVAHVFVQSATFLPVTALMLVCAYCLAGAHLLSRRPPLKEAMTILALQVASGVAGFLLLAPLWFPIIESFPITSIFSQYSRREYASANLSAFLAVFSPKHFWMSYNSSDGFDHLNIDRINIFVQHIGIASALVASHALSKPSRNGRLVAGAAAALVGISLFRIFGLPPLGLVDHVPFFKFFRMPYWGAMTAFAITILVAFGVERLNRRSAFSWPAGVAFLILGAAFSHAALRVGVPGGGKRWYVAVMVGLTAVSVVLLLLVRIGKGSERLWKTALVGLMACELLFYMNGLRPKRHDIMDPRPDFVQFLRQESEASRVLNVGRVGIHPDWGAAFQIAQLGAMTASQLPWYRDAYYQLVGREWSFLTLGLNTKREPTLNEAGLDMLGVRHVVVSRTMRHYMSFFSERAYPRVFEDRKRVIFENEDPWPRAFAASTLLRSRGYSALSGNPGPGLAWSDDSRLLEEALDARVRVVGGGDGEPAVPYHVEIRSHRHAAVSLEVEVPEPAVIVLIETWHPSWRAKVDGAERYVGRVNGAFRGMVVDSGRHRLELRYAPRSLNAAMTVTGLLLVGLAGLAVASRRQARSRAEY